MNRLVTFSAIACLICVGAIMQGTPLLAQENSTDDGKYTIYTSIESDSSNNVVGYVEDPIADYDMYSDFEVEYYPSWSLSGSNYYDSGTGYDFSSGPVPGGSNYIATFYYDITYYYVDQYDEGYCPGWDGWCQGWDYPTGYASIYISAPLLPDASIASISPGSPWPPNSNFTVEIDGSNFGSSPSVSVSDSYGLVSASGAYNSDPGGTYTFIDVQTGNVSATDDVTITLYPSASNGCQYNCFYPVGGGSGGGNGAASANAQVYPAPSVAAIYFIDPYRVPGYGPNSTSIDPATVLSSLPSTTGCDPNSNDDCAASLTRDGASTAIVVVQEAQPTTIELSLNSTGSTLLQYDQNFLGKTPAAGQTTLSVTPTAYNGSYYALALLLSPNDSSSMSSNSVTLQASAGSSSMYGSLPLTYPIAILVHGIWGNASSLDDGTGISIGDSLRANGYPPGWVWDVCYSSYVYWYATTDTVPGGNQCEQTSASAIAGMLRDKVYPTYDVHHVVGGRVDMVAHSMGGLAARNYGGLANYLTEPRSRNLGAIHDLITIDTPLQGSGLASYMLELAPKMPQLPAYGGLVSENIFSVAECDYYAPAQDCFSTLALPLASQAVDPSTGQPFSITTGAVYSLQPSVISQQLSPIKPINSTWTTISASFSESSLTVSALRFVLQELVYNFYDPSETPPGLTDEINDPSGTNDVIVGMTSQTVGSGGVGPDFGVPIGGNLQHTNTPNLPSFTSYIPGFSDANVLHSADVNSAIQDALKR